jgi:hypothetical protein
MLLATHKIIKKAIVLEIFKKFPLGVDQQNSKDKNYLSNAPKLRKIYSFSSSM